MKFLDDMDIGIGPDGLLKDRSAQALKSASALAVMQTIQSAGGKWSRLAGVPEQVMDSLRDNAQTNLGRVVADMNTYFYLAVPEDVDILEWIDALNALPEVELASPVPVPTLPSTPDFRLLQGYLNAATDGIDADYAWSLPGGTGSNTIIRDLEYAWNLNHQDLPPGIVTLVPPGYTASDPPEPVGDPRSHINHGTAVLGEMVSLNNGWGTTGAAYGATARVAPVYLDNGNGSDYRVATAMTNAIAHLTSGDVILIEQQIPGPNFPPGGNTQFGDVPMEWDQSVYNAIVTAVGNGIHVVEPAGNGSQNLDAPEYNTRHAPFRADHNSGAIMVGAGAAPAAFGGSEADRSRLDFSNYGSRVDLQGWGEMVMTTGTGSYYSNGQDLEYTGTFGGTSSASPIVASAVALVESIYEQNTGTVLKPGAMRSLLSITGSPQQAGTNPTSEHIGPRPNLRAVVGSTVVPFTNGTPPEYRNDDGSTDPIPLSFPFCFYDQTRNLVYINNNGNLSFEGPYWHYTPEGFPICGFGMISAFWADVDTRNSQSGLVYYKSEPHRFTVIWDHVGYYSIHADKLNTFEIVITDGTDPLVGIGKNVAFSYADMQWTTGDASGGVGGFGGAAATVGANRGDCTNYALVGRFDHEGIDFDGAGGNNDGISYLDGKTCAFGVCGGLGTIRGTKFNDMNGNCVQDPGEAGLPGWTITLNPGGRATMTNVNGGYVFSPLEPNAYTVSEVPKPNWEQTCPPPPGTHVVALSEGQTVSGMDFGNRAVANIQDLSASVAGGRARSGFPKFYGITYSNKGTLPTAGVVALSLPPQVSHLESSPGGVYDAGSHAVVWNVGTLPPGFIGWLWTKVQVPVLPLTTVLTSSVLIEPIAGDVLPADNTDIESQLLRGSYDPNEKLVTPSGQIARTDTLRYQVNFQNVGTDTAFNIIIRDTLDPNLDITTLDVGASSHPYVFYLVGRELNWIFDSILLPDSNVNEPASNGFVSFKVRPMADAPSGAEIRNYASVYFDFNPPVVTNTVTNRIGCTLCGIVRSGGDDGGSDFFVVCDSFYTGPHLDSIVCTGIDTTGPILNLPLEGAIVSVYTSYPNGEVVFEDTTNGGGGFCISDLDDTTSYVLRITHDGFCPQLMPTRCSEGYVNVPMSQLPTITTTPFVADYWSQDARQEGTLLKVGDVITAVDPNGVVCGKAIVSVPGSYLIHVMGDDPTTPNVDEGAVEDDELTFYLNCTCALPVPTHWTERTSTPFNASFNCAQRTLQIPVCNPWTLLSFNVIPPDASLSSVLNSIDGQYQRVLTSTCADGALSWEAGRPVNDLSSMDPFHGFWMKSTGPGVGPIAITGLPVPVDTPIVLCEGWNLISYLPDVPDTFTHALSSISGQYSLIFGFECGNGYTSWDAGRPANLNDLNCMKPTRGYWIKTTTSTTLTYPRFGYVCNEAGPALAKPVNLLTRVTPTPWLADFWSVANTSVSGLHAGDRLTVRTSAGVICGECVVGPDGAFLVHVYGDDPTTKDRVEGAVAGEALRFEVNEAPAFVQSGSAIWTDRQSTALIVTVAKLNPVPTNYALLQNYPNPFNAGTVIPFALKKSAQWSLKIYSVTGQLIRTFSGEAGAGVVTVSWDGTAENGQAVSSGVYFYRVRTPEWSDSRKMLLVK